ncbi:hypothetical protein DY000_02049546 [Brassica cretica]|uniref:Uncharacterized protein n=1 Tax=Brassica cretica TaxID=69181 RepID=A0ABQ7F856_BRACR|nr:hypothetical protein DY000_02049546 [Brassica cretica]
MRGGSQERECSAKCMKAEAERNPKALRKRLSIVEERKTDDERSSTILVEGKEASLCSWLAFRLRFQRPKTEQEKHEENLQFSAVCNMVSELLLIPGAFLNKTEES